MKALSIVAPGGRLIAEGAKTLEIRRWAPAIDPAEDLLIVENDRFLRKDGEIDPAGKVVALVRVGRIRPFVAGDIKAACANYYESGWLAWELMLIRRIDCDRQVPAARGIYEIDFDPMRL